MDEGKEFKMNAKKFQIIFAMLVVIAILLAACAGAIPESQGSAEVHPEPVGIYARETSSLPPASGYQMLPAEIGRVYLESENGILVVFRVDTGEEIGRLEYISRPVIADQMRWGPGDQVVNAKDGLAEICIDMGENVGGPCYKVSFDGQWFVESQLHLSEAAEPIVESPDEKDFTPLMPERSIIELHVFREEENFFPGEWRSDFPIKFYSGYFTVEVNEEGNLVVWRNDQNRLAAKIVLFPSGTIQICPPCQSQGMNPEKDIFTISLMGETPQGVIGGPVVVARFRENGWQVQIPPGD